MVRKILISIIVFYIITIFQASFLVHFNIFSGSFRGSSPILFLIIILNLFEKPKDNSGIFIGFFAGFFLDVFSENPFNFFGFYTLISLTLAVFIKFILTEYFRISLWKNIWKEKE